MIWRPVSRGTLALLAAAGCGRAGYEPLLVGEVDAGPAPADAVPTGVDGGWPVGPFGEAAAWSELASDADDRDPTLTADLLEIYFASNRDAVNNFEIYRSARDSVDEPWSEPVRVLELSTVNYDVNPEISPDGLTISVSRTHLESEGGTDIYFSTRETRADPWSTPLRRDAELSSSRSEYGAAIDGSGTRIVLARANPTTGLDIMEATRTAVDGPWSEPGPLANLMEPGFESDAHIDPSARHLAFSGDLGDNEGARELYLTSRASVEDDFAPRMRLGELSTDRNEDDPWLSPDGALMVFTSNRDGDVDIYAAER